jgi:hypothetical protein
MDASWLLGVRAGQIGAERRHPARRRSQARFLLTSQIRSPILTHRILGWCFVLSATLRSLLAVEDAEEEGLTCCCLVEAAAAPL